MPKIIGTNIPTMYGANGASIGPIIGIPITNPEIVLFRTAAAAIEAAGFNEPDAAAVSAAPASAICLCVSVSS